MGLSLPKRAIGASIAAAIVAVGGYAVSRSILPDPLSTTGATTTTPPVGTANIWVDADGGTCADSTSLVGYDTATACGSLDAANDTCDNGDLVLIKTGTSYIGDQVFNGNNGRTAMCRMRPDSTTAKAILIGDVVFGQPNTQPGPDFLTLRNIQCGNNASRTDPTNEYELLIYPGSDGGSNNLTLNRFDCASFDVFGSSNVTISNGDFGPCGSSGSRKCVTRIAHGNGATGVKIIRNRIHDISCGNGLPVECGNNHTDGIAIFGGANTTVRGNKFYRNDIINVRIQLCCGNNPITNLTLENNWFGPICVTPSDGSVFTPCGLGSRPGSIDVDSPLDCFKLRFNSFSTGAGVAQNGSSYGTSACPAEFVGNALTVSNNCGTLVNYRYNASLPFSQYNGQTPCGSTDVKVSGFGYTTETVTSIDYHIVAGTVLNNIVPTSVTGGCVNVDIDGTARPTGMLCDAGSDER